MTSKLKKVLVVGGAGYIGGGITDILLGKNIPFAVYDRLLYENHYFKPADFIYGDIRDTKKLSKVLLDFSHVIWLAAIVGDTACKVNPALAVSINEEAVKWLTGHFNGRIIFLSTCSVYGKSDQVADENSPARPLSLYAETKLNAEKYLQGKDSLILRLGTVYGITDSYTRLRMDLVLNYMTANAVTKGQLVVFGGNQWRPLVHVKDIATVIVNNLEKSISGIYNVTTTNLQIKDLAETIGNITGCKIEHTERKPGDQRSYKASTEKAVKDGVLNLERTRDVAYGVKEIANLIKSGRVKDIENDVYFNERYLTKLKKNGKLT